MHAQYSVLKMAMHINSKERSSDCNTMRRITQQSIQFNSNQFAIQFCSLQFDTANHTATSVSAETARDSISHSRAVSKLALAEGLNAASRCLPSAGMQRA